jgi:hypothetical protein
VSTCPHAEQLDTAASCEGSGRSKALLLRVPSDDSDVQYLLSTVRRKRESQSSTCHTARLVVSANNIWGNLSASYLGKDGLVLGLATRRFLRTVARSSTEGWH